MVHHERLDEVTARLTEVEAFLEPLAKEDCQDPRSDGYGGWHECGGCWPCRAKQLCGLTLNMREIMER